ncbi:MAG: transposase [Arcobacter sp.]|nr:MAG: transposase [Arcobacter sp.]
MPRVARALADDQIYHIINRGNRREKIFHDEYDFTKILELFSKAKDRFRIKIYAYCLMDNHYHLVLYTEYGKSLSECMQWIGTSYVRYYNKRYKTSGHLWQGRYKSFIVQKESYFISLIKYVEANPLRANIVKDASEYKYSSLIQRDRKEQNLLDALPVEIPSNWIDFVNDVEKESDIEIIRNSINRQAPLGEQGWQEIMCERYGIESSIRARGRPKKDDLE